MIINPVKAFFFFSGFFLVSGTLESSFRGKYFCTFVNVGVLTVFPLFVFFLCVVGGFLRVSVAFHKTIDSRRGNLLCVALFFIILVVCLVTSKVQ